MNSMTPSQLLDIAVMSVAMIAAFFLAFSVTVLLLLCFPRVRVKERFKDAERVRLVLENQALMIENRNATLGLEKLNLRVSHIEETAKQIDDLITTN